MTVQAETNKVIIVINGKNYGCSVVFIFLPKDYQSLYCQQKINRKMKKKVKIVVFSTPQFKTWKL